MAYRYFTIGAVLLPALILAGCGSPAKEIKLDEEVVRVHTMAVSAVDKPEILSYSGTIAADNRVNLSFLVAGQVSDVYTEEGQLVKAGKLLASIEPTEYRNSLLLTEAGLEQTKDNFTRLERLHQNGSLPERDYVTAKVAMVQAEINKNQAAKRLNDTKLFAPFSGIISAKQIEKGASVGPGVNAFTIIKTDEVYAQASVTEEDITRIGVGDEVVVSIPALKDSLKGKITIINPEADNLSRTFIVKVSLPNSNGNILPGMLATINVFTHHTNAVIAVPVQTIVRDADDIPYVFVLDKSGHAIRKRVRIGKLLSNEVTITDGLKSNDLVVVEGQNKLRDGLKVIQVSN